MSDVDVIDVLETQTKQAEILLQRLSLRMERTKELKALEQERRKLAGKIGELEAALGEIDRKIIHWQAVAQQQNTVDEQSLIKQLNKAWSAIAAAASASSQNGMFQSPTISLLAPVERVAAPQSVIKPTDNADDIDWASVINEASSIPASGSMSVVDALDVLDEFFSDFSGDSPSSRHFADDDFAGNAGTFFDNSVTLADDAETKEDDWFLQGESSGVDGNDWWRQPEENNEERVAAPIVMESPAAVENGNAHSRKGWLGRFF